MGNWNILIQGFGSHHNEGNATDAQRLTVQFIDDLIAAGHEVKTASFFTGNEDLLEPNQWTQKLDRPLCKDGQHSGFCISNKILGASTCTKCGRHVTFIHEDGGLNGWYLTK